MIEHACTERRGGVDIRMIKAALAKLPRGSSVNGRGECIRRGTKEQAAGRATFKVKLLKARLHRLAG